MTVYEAYKTWATTYDSDENPTRDLDTFVTKTTLSGRCYQSILEIGCGTGKNTRLLAEIGTAVRALDFSEQMIDRARAKIEADNVAFAVADLTQRWPTDDKMADLIVCNLVLEHIEDLDFIFAEARRSLKEDGHFFICEYHPFRQYMGGKANFQRGEQTIEIPAFVHHISEFTDTAVNNDFTLIEFKEWQRDEDEIPRLASFMFEKKQAD
ncbi:MAG: class I SAM-dependent methyltransferase [Chloroflexi bacterium]|nr:class I SAM-dependent methyltransferase [Chloroflexota bacterium]